MHGFALYRTGAEELAWMNRTALAFEGTVNVGTGKLIAVHRKPGFREYLFSAIE